MGLAFCGDDDGTWQLVYLGLDRVQIGVHYAGIKASQG
jgi:hypothetical protein